MGVGVRGWWFLAYDGFAIFSIRWRVKVTVKASDGGFGMHCYPVDGAVSVPGQPNSRGMP